MSPQDMILQGKQVENIVSRCNRTLFHLKIGGGGFFWTKRNFFTIFWGCFGPKWAFSPLQDDFGRKMAENAIFERRNQKSVLLQLESMQKSIFSLKFEARRHFVYFLETYNILTYILCNNVDISMLYRVFLAQF